MEPGKHTSTQEEFIVVERVARIVSSVRGTKPDYTRLAAELESVIPFDVFGIVLLRHDREAVRVTVCQREEDEEYAEGKRQVHWVAQQHQHPREGSMLACVLNAPQLLVKEYARGVDGPPAASGDALSSYHQLRSTLIAPLVIEEQRVLGTLELGTTAPGTYSAAALQRLVSAVASVLATAIESAQLGGNTEIQNRQRQVLKDVSSALTAKTDLPVILEQIVSGIAGSLNVAAAILRYDRQEQVLRLEAEAGFDRDGLRDILTQNSCLHEECIIGNTLFRRQPSVSYDIAKDERFPLSRVLAESLGIHSVYTYPLITGTTIYGILLLGSVAPGGFTPLKTDILSLFASQATIAIHNGMLLESARQRSYFQKTLEQFEQALQRNLTYVSQTEKPGDGSETAEREEEYKLFMHVRKVTQRTFGVSFASLLRFISDHLLTHDEYALQAVFSGRQEVNGETEAFQSGASPAQERDSVPLPTRRTEQNSAPLADTLALLTQTAEAALVRAGMLGELSRLLSQLKQSTNWVRDPWFVVDLAGQCMYMNRAAEALCSVRVEDMEASRGSEALMIERVFEHVLPRVRNVEEVLIYLQGFTHESPSRQEMRCVLALEPVHTARSKQHLSTPGAQHADQNSAQQQAPKVAYGRNKQKSLLLESAPSDYHYQLIRYPLCNQQGQVIGNALQMRDVTEQVRDEKNMSALLSSVSHDLRTPLTTIKAAVTGLLQTNVAWREQDRREMLEDIDRETDHLTVMVNALVEMSRIEMGALILEKEWCDLVEVVYGTMAKMERTLAGRHIQLDLQPQLPLVYVDHAQLERVLYNLIDNAVRHSPDNAEIIIALDVVGEVQQTRQETPETGTSGQITLDFARVRVIDYGCGVPAHERERIFRSFYSLRSYGSGLGLAICKGIIEAHQGRIWVEPAHGNGGKQQGSCFIFTLPVYPYTL